MKSLFARSVLLFVSVLIFAGAHSSIAMENSKPAKKLHELPIYFDFGEGLIEEFKGTYAFNYKKLEFIKNGLSDYIINSSGDQSPSQDRLSIQSDYTYWILTWSNENWFIIKNNLKKGDRWKNHLRGWKETYEVTDMEVTLWTPAGTFAKCAKIKISWVAHEHDTEGLQEVILYLAPHLGIVKQEHYDEGNKWHEEILTSFKRKF